ncbi:hypothetical protein LCGC14_3048120 [marine sediment metagenome]|uniref:Uncharacterized protein n=1 Tax=marine sediment metagenome TaxID=412755 RepID=A0A0F8ZDG1_9ZZZZ
MYRAYKETDIRSPEFLHKYYFFINMLSLEIKRCNYKTEDETKLARFKLVERWNACLDMIYSQTWCPEAGTYSSSSKPIKEDKYEGYRE